MADVPLSTAIYLMLTGGLLIATANAAGRRDALHGLLFGFLVIVAAHLAGLPATLLAWACYGFGVALVLVAVAALVRSATGGRTAAPLAFSAAVITLALSLSGSGSASAVGTPGTALAIGRALHNQLAAVLDPERRPG